MKNERKNMELEKIAREAARKSREVFTELPISDPDEFEAILQAHFLSALTRVTENAEKEKAELRGALEKLIDKRGKCPWCGYSQGFHVEGCFVGKALGKTEALEATTREGESEKPL